MLWILLPDFPGYGCVDPPTPWATGKQIGAEDPAIRLADRWVSRILLPHGPRASRLVLWILLPDFPGMGVVDPPTPWARGKQNGALDPIPDFPGYECRGSFYPLGHGQADWC